jgi:hypothetical protein
MSVLKTLSMNHMRVLIGLCNYPMESDSFIATKIGVKRSTYATVKKRLIEPPNSILSPINIPNFHMLGAELLSIYNVKLNLKSGSKDSGLKGIDPAIKLPNVISSFFDSDSGYVLKVSKSFSDLVYTQNLLSGYGGDQDIFSPSNINRIIIPLAYNGFSRFLNYSDCFSYHWNIPIEKDNSLEPIFPNKKVDLNSISPLGWQIFDSIIKYPDYTILELAKLLKKPRNTITRWIRKLRNMMLYQKRYLPDLPKIGFNIHLFLSIYVQGVTDEKRYEILGLMKDIFHPEDILWSYQSIFLSAVFPDYGSLREKEGKFLEEMSLLEFPFTYNKYTHSINKVVLIKSLKNSLPHLVTYLRGSNKYSLATSRSF